MENTHYDYIDFIRIICAFAVVVLHTVSISMTCAGEEITENVKNICTAIYSCMNFAVPIFLMITGTLFLKEGKEHTFCNMIKYIRRVILCILVFGMFFSISEQFFNMREFHAAMIFNAVLDIVKGKLWDHMWYLYFLPGVYLIIPVLQKFKKTASLKEYIAFCCIVFVFTYIFPLCEKIFNLKIGFTFPLNSALLFYVILGGVFADYVPKPKNTAIFGFISLLCFTLIILVKMFSISAIDTGYDSLIICILSSSAFLTMKGIFYNIKAPVFVLSISKATFGIYIIHPVFLNFMVKAFDKNPILSFCPTLMVFLYCVLTFAASFLCVYVAKKIKPIGKYLL